MQSGMFQPTEKQLRVLGAYVTAGSCRAAAEDLGLAEQTVKNALYLLRLRARVATNQQLVYEFGDLLRRMRRPGA